MKWKKKSHYISALNNEVDEYSIDSYGVLDTPTLQLRFTLFEDSELLGYYKTRQEVEARIQELES